MTKIASRGGGGSWSILTFLHHGIETVETGILCENRMKKIQRKSWSIHCATEVARLYYTKRLAWYIVRRRYSWEVYQIMTSFDTVFDMRSMVAETLAWIYRSTYRSCASFSGQRISAEWINQMAQRCFNVTHVTWGNIQIWLKVVKLQRRNLRDKVYLTKDAFQEEWNKKKLGHRCTSCRERERERERESERVKGVMEQMREGECYCRRCICMPSYAASSLHWSCSMTKPRGCPRVYVELSRVPEIYCDCATAI